MKIYGDLKKMVTHKKVKQNLKSFQADHFRPKSKRKHERVIFLGHPVSEDIKIYIQVIYSSLKV